MTKTDLIPNRQRKTHRLTLRVSGDKNHPEIKSFFLKKETAERVAQNINSRDQFIVLPGERVYPKFGAILEPIEEIYDQLFSFEYVAFEEKLVRFYNFRGCKVAVFCKKKFRAKNMQPLAMPEYFFELDGRKYELVDFCERKYAAKECRELKLRKGFDKASKI